MIDRRTFSALLASAVAAPRSVWSQTMPHKAVFYSSVGPALTLYHLDLEKAALARQSTVQLPANVQYAWAHSSAHFLYVASSSGGPASRGVQGTKHYLSALRVDPASGALQAHGPSAALRSRPIHMSLDRTGAYALTAYNNPSGVTVHRINADGTVGEEVKQTTSLDGGIYGHQVRVTPANNAAILVTRGNAAAGGKPEDPGALKVYGFKDGQLTNRASIAPNGGYGFGPRHLDFHPTLPLAYLSLETQNKLYVYRLKDDTLEPEAIFKQETLAEPGNIRGRQAASTVHVHPKRPLRLRRQPRERDRRVRGQEGLSRRREQHRGVRHRPVDRRANADPEHRRARHPSAHLLARPLRPHAGVGPDPADAGARGRRREVGAGEPHDLPGRRRRQAHFRQRL